MAISASNNPRAADLALIKKIATRGVAMSKDQGHAWKHCDAVMDLTCIHFKSCPLRLQELLDADDLNFAHDVFGINRHLDRNTFTLGGFFLPRFAQPESMRKAG